MANEYGSYMDAAANYDDGSGVRFRGTCIRFAPGKAHTGNETDGAWFEGDAGPYVHANSAHISSGVQGVSVDFQGRLVIDTDGMTPVTAGIVSGDETLSARGIFGGASVGTNTVITFYKVGKGRLYLNQQADWDAIASTLSNVWVFWMSVNDRSGIKLTDLRSDIVALQSEQATLDLRTGSLESVTTDLEARVAALEGQ